MNNNFAQLSQKDKRDIIVCELEARSSGMTNAGSSSITFDTNLKLRACFQADVLTNRNSRILINRLLCGNVANHQTCKKCQGTASSIHVIQCTGIETAHAVSCDPPGRVGSMDPSPSILGILTRVNLCVRIYVLSTTGCS
jgi:hypothetical protein